MFLLLFLYKEVLTNGLILFLYLEIKEVFTPAYVFLLETLTISFSFLLLVLVLLFVLLFFCKLFLVEHGTEDI